MQIKKRRTEKSITKNFGVRKSDFPIFLLQIFCPYQQSRGGRNDAGPQRADKRSVMRRFGLSKSADARLPAFFLYAMMKMV
jgi:hypothetical protein